VEKGELTGMGFIDDDYPVRQINRELAMFLTHRFEDPFVELFLVGAVVPHGFFELLPVQKKSIAWNVGSIPRDLISNCVTLYSFFLSFVSRLPGARDRRLRHQVGRFLLPNESLHKSTFRLAS